MGIQVAQKAADEALGGNGEVVKLLELVLSQELEVQGDVEVRLDFPTKRRAIR